MAPSHSAKHLKEEIMPTRIRQKKKKEKVKDKQMWKNICSKDDKG